MSYRTPDGAWRKLPGVTGRRLRPLLIAIGVAL